MNDRTTAALRAYFLRFPTLDAAREVVAAIDAETKSPDAPAADAKPQRVAKKNDNGAIS